ncbi:hypothetical protein WK12_11785 [Burkholderia ubonensis]|nr:hypothetical protein WK12_11785 [Burkholderia ubonensis]
MAMDEEKALFGSMSDGRARQEQLKPRANKPDTYLLHADGELVGAYGSAYDALRGLRDQAAAPGQKIEIRDPGGAMLAEKRFAEVLNTTNLLQASRLVPKLYLSEDMRRDLVAEGRDPSAPFRDVRPIEPEKRSASNDWFKDLQALNRQVNDVRRAQAEHTRPTPERSADLPAWRAALQAMPTTKPAPVTERDSTFTTVVSPPIAQPKHGYEMELS